MIPIPSPLHAAIVHFPIVLILVGAAAAVVAVGTSRWNLPALAALLLGMGACGSVISVMTGKDEGELVATAGPIERILDQHEAWAERTRAFACVATVLALGAVLTARSFALSRTFAAGTAVVAVVASWCVFQTGHYGGQLVYRHGAGVTVTTAPASPALTEVQHSYVDDD